MMYLASVGDSLHGTTRMVNLALAIAQHLTEIEQVYASQLRLNVEIVSTISYHSKTDINNCDVSTNFVDSY